MATCVTLQNAVEGKTPPTPSSSKNLAASIGRNTLFGIGANLAQMGTRLVTVPMVIGYLGLDGYGIWSIIMTTGAYMRFGSAGVRCAFQKYVAEATGSGNFDRANKLISTGTAAIMLLSMAALIPIAIFSRTLAAATGVPDHFLHSTAWAISLLALMMVLSNTGACYEAIVMGGHRIDIVRRFNTVSAIAEATAIVTLLHFGYGLFAMSAVMAIAESVYIPCCYFASRKVLPAIEVSFRHLSRGVWRELITFAGSYQLVSILEVLYAAILPVAVLKFYGAHAAGVYALGNRLVSVALLPIVAFLVPILSGGSMVYSSASVDEMGLFLAKAFKTTLALAMLPLAFIASYGTIIILAWTGQADSSFRVVLWLMCLAAFFRSLSSLGRVLYRISGKSLIDNVQQVIMILILVSFCNFGPQLGFLGVLCGLVAAEFIGAIFMYLAVINTFHGLSARMVIPVTLKLTTATLAMLAVGAVVARLLAQWSNTVRFLAAFKLGAISLTIFVIALPVLLLTGSLSTAEVRAILRAFRKPTDAGIRS